MRPLPDHASDTVPYAKMNGAGNQILVMDLRGGPHIGPDRARRLAAHPHLVFDQLMAISAPRTPGTDAFVIIYNRDGSPAGACGNGMRCVAWYLMRDKEVSHLLVETMSGPVACRRDEAGTFTVDMGPPRTGWHDIPLRDAVEETGAFRLVPESEWIAALGPAAAVSMGNPHVVFWLDPAAPKPDLTRLGPALEHHPMFPDRANVSFARVLGHAHIGLDVWERGAGLTRACGSAACATLVAAVRNGLTGRRARIDLPGGTLDVVWRESDGHVLLSGPVELERCGHLGDDEA